jgi:ferrous iron transport protein B
MGKTIEPAISIRLWLKIGIAIISSFAAREVFVGTLATIYSVGGTDNEDTIKIKWLLRSTHTKVFNFASGISLLLLCLYDQCAKHTSHHCKETNTWKWPIGQLILWVALLM